MRPATVALAAALAAVLAALAAVAPAAAHGAHQGHGQPMMGTLDPGASVTYQLAFNDLPLQAGWWWLLSGELRGAGALHATLRSPALVVAQWTFEAPRDLREDGDELPRVRLPSDAYYTLELSNPSSQPVQFFLFFDQTCECSAKPMPINGTLWFNLDASAIGADRGDRVDLRFTVLSQPSPDRFRTLALSTVDLRVMRLGSPDGTGPVQTTTVDMQAAPSHVIEAPFTMGSGTQYFLITGNWKEQGWDVIVAPSWEVHAASTPLPAWLVVAALAALALARR